MIEKKTCGENNLGKIAKTAWELHFWGQVGWLEGGGGMASQFFNFWGSGGGSPAVPPLGANPDKM